MRKAPEPEKYKHKRNRYGDNYCGRYTDYVYTVRTWDKVTCKGCLKARPK